MTKHPEHCNDLCNYVKECLVMDKLCDYLCSCCNSDNISNNMMKEYKDKCNSMGKKYAKIIKTYAKKKNVNIFVVKKWLNYVNKY